METEKTGTAAREMHPRTFEPATLGMILFLTFFGSIIGMQIYATLGFTPNTAIIGVLVAISVSRVSFGFLRSFRDIHRQNLVQSAISCSTFSAANSMLLPIGVMYILDRIDLVVPLLCGCVIGQIIDLFMLYWMFDSKAFPATAPWPAGVAAAEAIYAGDRGGKRAVLLVGGIAAGAVGSFFKIPMSALGCAMMANQWAMLMFATGLLVRGYSVQLFGFDLNSVYIPHGFMIGAGIAACLQIMASLYKNQKGRSTDKMCIGVTTCTRSDKDVLKGIQRGFGLYTVSGIALCILTGLYTIVSPGMMVGWVVYSVISCILAEFIIGLSTMQSGWFPSFPVTLIFLVIGIILGFPGPALAVMVGFIISGGPAFADAGYDFKAGWILRGRGADSIYELAGRKQQLLAALTGVFMATVVVYFFHDTYLSQGLFPPPSRVFAATIQAGVNSDIMQNMLLWAIPGAILQFIGGTQRQMGVLMGTGLLILNPIAGIVVIVGLIIRQVIYRWKGEKAMNEAVVIAAGCIAGDALYGFFNSMFRTGIHRIK